jgi:hypothetical protein
MMIYGYIYIWCIRIPLDYQYVSPNGVLFSCVQRSNLWQMNIYSDTKPVSVYMKVCT